MQMTETVAVWLGHRSRRRKKAEAADPFGKTPEMMCLGCGFSAVMGEKRDFLCFHFE